MSAHSIGIIHLSDKINNPDYIVSDIINELKLLDYKTDEIKVISVEPEQILTKFELVIKTCDVILVVSSNCPIIYNKICELTAQNLKYCRELEPYEKECFIPQQANVIASDNYPIVYFQRIYIINENYRSLAPLKEHLTQYRKPLIFEKFLKIPKNGIPLNEIAFPEHCGTIENQSNEKFHIFKITSNDFPGFVKLQQFIENKFGPGKVELRDDLQHIYERGKNHVRVALDLIERALTQYGPENIFLSFNGGKDCTVLLHLVLVALKRKFPHFNQAIFCLYVQSNIPFPEQEEFIRQCRIFYNLKIVTKRSDIKSALKETLEAFPNYKACFMGTRRTDPFSSDLEVFQMTDLNWPQIMRINPLLDWHYSDIWDYLLYYKIPYCSLYDLGFTSLGNVENTTRNPSLLYEIEGKEVYLPAHKLLVQNKERNGRITQ